MKLSSVALIGFLSSASAFAPQSRLSRPTSLNGYLDDLSPELYAENPDEVEEDDSRDATKMSKEDVANFGVGAWDSYVEFNEFDGGDGQMGVAGDGNVQLESFDTTEVFKSKSMSAKNAWGTNSGYGDTLRESGMDTARAQQLENWHNQQEVLNQRKQQRFMTEDFDNVETDENWRELAKFGVERNTDTDLDEEFGAVTIGEIEGTIEVTGRMNGVAGVHEFGLRNPYMGFADFRAAFAPGTGVGWTIDPAEGSLMQKEDTNFILRFKPNAPGVSEGYLVIETEDVKKTWKLIGTTA
mmetsp:Transcript_115022/g.171921  ORF Transcript_115022/g.171921 Transcript_115022/m.171921 type:complete len:297 (+) Transcript_115022:97-987(+)|eukprot:CAMPEP_0117026628 /NCGR_PEP_ID=MMETSP0472-20121206/19560_1 /TAXON_ID=693140 ORGANISM="Tiarina fusus, Strain LIS" /NCGR_SAMPLE_ID=MMETSP0472 /ASSEMBLY_ACC=CAM_ASM_000603 /LENGTH=296 /DNA_ID=CAMNT_0004733691 /DNA_START=92 /DNA_END=982 /DNA_ORIENTATION=+